MKLFTIGFVCVYIYIYIYMILHYLPVVLQNIKLYIEHIVARIFFFFLIHIRNFGVAL